jgi:hypothetical protein
MIIVWWWSYGGLGEDSDKWIVSDTSAEDCVVRIDQRFSPNAKSIIASNAVKHLEDSEVFIFLHRNHGYNGQAIEDILAEIKKHHPDASNVRCFLFGEGNGSLYIASNSRGLLGTKGTFNAQRVNGTTQWIDAREDEEQKLLKKDHFDFVWNAYTKAFKAKVFELREDIFSSLSPFLTRKDTKADELYQHLRGPNNKLLFLRLLSFTGKLRKGSSQEKLLLEQENLLGRALDFDDFSTNLGTVYTGHTSSIYKNLSHYITQNIFTGTNQIDLKNLRDQFSELLQSMPEEIYN